MTTAGWAGPESAAMAVGSAWLRDRAAVLRCVAMLPADQREFVEMRMLRGISMADVATVLRRSPAAVEVLGHRSVHRLAELLGMDEHAGDPPGLPTRAAGARGREFATVTALWQRDPDLFERCLDQLSADQREYIELRVVERRSVAEIATVMRRTDNAVRVLQHRAVRRVVALLDDPAAARNGGPLATVRTAARGNPQVWRRCVEQLSDSRRECVELRIVRGLSVAEAARLMRRSENATRVLLHVAVRNLADLLSGGSSPAPDEVMEAVAVAARHDPDALRAQLRKLSPGQRECVQRRFLEGRSVADTAKVMERGAAAVRTMQVGAARRLADLLACGNAPAPGPALRVVSDAVGAGEQAALRAAIATLRPDHQECARLRVLDGLSPAETATRMGRSDKAVRVLFYNAIARLAEMLTGTTGVEDRAVI